MTEDPKRKKRRGCKKTRPVNLPKKAEAQVTNKLLVPPPFPASPQEEASAGAEARASFRGGFLFEEVGLIQGPG